MKTAIMMIALIFAFAGLSAQDVTVPSQPDMNKAAGDASRQVGAGGSVGSLMGQLSDNLKDEALTDEFKESKGQFASSAENTTDPGMLGTLLQKLQGGIASSAMDKGWDTVKEKWLTDTKTAGSVEKVAGLLQKLETHISPSAFKDSWSSVKPMWDNALGAIAK